MTKWDDYWKTQKHCRWCGEPYKAFKPVGRDGFHSNRCKMAHARAYKKYVTRKTDIHGAPAACRKNRVTKKTKEKA